MPELPSDFDPWGDDWPPEGSLGAFGLSTRARYLEAGCQEDDDRYQGLFCDYQYPWSALAGVRLGR